MTNRYTTRTWAEIDLDALTQNLKSIRAITNENAKVMCVVKADAYGHGFFEAAKTMELAGADAFAVATFEEAVHLREKGFTQMILILSQVDPLYADELVRQNISVTVFDLAFAQKMADSAQKQNKPANIHIKLDTGMSRVGFGCSEKGIEEIAAVCSLPGIHPQGIFTHFACADEKDRTMSDAQFVAFTNTINALKQKNISFEYAHICNSAGIMEFPEYHLSMVRPGIILYGCYPSDAVQKEALPLVPAMTVKARVTRIDTKKKGTPVSYGATFVCDRDMKIATVSIGYADGYFRTLSGKAYMTVCGKSVPVVGRICMDQCMIDVTNVHTITVGDEVTVFGKADGVSETATTLAEKAGTINYEILCAVGNRTPRIYLKNGKMIDVLTYL